MKMPDRLSAEAQYGPKGPRASVIIVSYNGLHYMAKCLNSVFSQAIDGGLEVIIVDNNSTDGCADFVERHFPQVRLLRQDENNGFAVACNIGARAAVGEVLVFLNQDTVVADGWLEELIIALSSDPTVGMVTSKVLMLSTPEKIHCCGLSLHYTGFGQALGKSSSAEGYAAKVEVNAISGTSFAVGKALWDQLDGFDEALFMYFEDLDLSWRAQLAGYRCLYVPSSVVYHDYTAKFSPVALFYSMRNPHLVRLKNWRWQTFLLLAPGIVLTELLTTALSLVLGWKQFLTKIRSYPALLEAAGKVMRTRKLVQGTRRVSDATLMARFSADLFVARDVNSLVMRLMGLANVCFRWHKRITVGLLRLAHL